MRATRRDEQARGRPHVALPAMLLIVTALLVQTASAQELSVVVSPERAIVLPGGEVAFSADVRDASGDAVAANVMWSVIPPRAGTVSVAGRFVAGRTEGRAIVRAVAVHGSASGTGHAVVEIGTESTSALLVSVEPRSATIGQGESKLFSASVTDPLTGDAVQAELRWVALPERLGSIDQSGLLTAGSEEMSGRVAVRASLGQREGVGDASVVVGSPPGNDIRVSVVPPAAVMEPGDEVGFEALVIDADGHPVDARVTWSAMPARLGVIDSNGRFTAGPDEGAGRLVATVATADGPSRGFASVEVRASGPTGVRVRVRPREAAVMAGGDVQFEAVVVGPDGVPLDIPVEWSIRPDWIGTIDQGGLFAAADEMPEPSSNGVWMGTAVASIETRAGIASDAARVIVRDGGPALKLRIYPHSPVVTPGQDVQFEARVIGAGEPFDWTTEWTVFPEDLGTITPDGLFTANPLFEDPTSDDFGPHQGVVGARATLDDGSILSDRAHVNVRIPGQPVRVRVRPAYAVVSPGESFGFEAVVTGPDGQELTLPVSWNVAPARIGHISQDGVFTAANLNVEPGSWQRPRGSVVAEISVGGGRVFRGAAAVVIDLPDPEIAVRISPKSVTLAEGEVFQFTAEAFTADGDALELDMEWKVSDPIVGTIDPAGLFTAAESLPQGHSRRSSVLAGGMYNGRVYWDYATVRISGGN